MPRSALLGGLPALVLVASACGASKRLEPALEASHSEGADPVRTLTAFLDAVDGGDFEQAWTLMAGPWRAQYTPESLAADLRAEPLAQERLRRARLAVRSAPEETADGAAFPLGNGRAVRLVREGRLLRVAALE